MKSSRVKAPLLVVCGLSFLAGCVPTPVAMTPRTAEDLHSAETDFVSDAESELRQRMINVLQLGLEQRQLSSTENAAWQIMHGVACYGMQLSISTPDRGDVGAVEYAFSEGKINGLELMPGDLLTSTGRRGIRARLEPGSYVGQGHVDQWIAICAMAELPRNTPITIDGQEFILEDWLRQAQFEVTENPLDEFGWTLIALTHYFPDEPVWQASDGAEISWEELVQVEVEQDLFDSACGGTHRLSGLVRALRAKERLGLPDTPVWQQAREMVDDCLTRAKDFRGAGGRLSSHYFERPGGTVDLTAELSSSGHVFEFLALALKPEELSQPWVELAGVRLCEILEASQQAALDCGALYHGLNGIKIYLERRYGSS